MLDFLFPLIVTGMIIYGIIIYLRREVNDMSDGTYSSKTYNNPNNRIEDLSYAEKVLRESAGQFYKSFSSNINRVRHHRYESAQQHLEDVYHMLKNQKSNIEGREIFLSFAELKRQHELINLAKSVDAYDNFNINRSRFEELQSISVERLRSAFDMNRQEPIERVEEVQADIEKPALQPVLNAFIPAVSLSKSVQEDKAAAIEPDQNKELEVIVESSEAVEEIDIVEAEVNISNTQAKEDSEAVKMLKEEFSSIAEAVEDIQEEKTYENSPEESELSYASEEQAIALVGESSYKAYTEQSGKEVLVSERKEKTPMSKNMANTLLLSLGTVFVLLAGILFATTSWSIMPGVVKIGLIFAVVAFFFAGSVFTEKKLKLSAASKALYILSSLFVFVAVISIAYFELFGSYFSLHNSSRYFVLFIASLGTELALFKALKKFNARWYTDICLYTISICVSFFVLSFNYSVTFNVTALTAYAIGCIIFEYLVDSSRIRISSDELKKDIASFAQINLLLVSLLILVLFRNSVAQAMVTVIMSITHLYVGDRRANKFNASAFLVFLGLAMYRLIYGGLEHSVTYAMMMMLSIFSATSMFFGFRQQTRKYSRMAASAGCIITFISSLAYLFIDGYVSVPSVMSMLLVWIHITISYIKDEETKIPPAHGLSSIILLNYVIALVPAAELELYALINVLACSVLILNRHKLKKTGMNIYGFAAISPYIITIGIYNVLAYTSLYEDRYIGGFAYLSVLICLLLSMGVIRSLDKEYDYFDKFTYITGCAIVILCTDIAGAYFGLKLNAQVFVYIYLLVCFIWDYAREKSVNKFLCAFVLAQAFRLWAVDALSEGSYLLDSYLISAYFTTIALYLLAHIIRHNYREGKEAYHLSMLICLYFAGFKFVDIYGLPAINVALIYLVVSIILYAVYQYPVKLFKVRLCINVVALILVAISVLRYRGFTDLNSMHLYPVIILLLIALHYINIYKDRLNISMIIISLWAYAILIFAHYDYSKWLENQYISHFVSLGVILSVMALSRLKTDIVAFKEDGKKVYDMWHIGIIGYFILTGIPYGINTEHIFFIYTLASAAYFIQYKHEHTDAVALFLALCSIQLQEFVELSFDNYIRLGNVLLFIYIYLLGFIYRKKFCESYRKLQPILYKCAFIPIALLAAYRVNKLEQLFIACVLIGIVAYKYFVKKIEDRVYLLMIALVNIYWVLAGINSRDINNLEAMYINHVITAFVIISSLIIYAYARSKKILYLEVINTGIISLWAMMIHFIGYMSIYEIYKLSEFGQYMMYSLVLLFMVAASLISRRKYDIIVIGEDGSLRFDILSIGIGAVLAVYTLTIYNNMSTFYGIALSLYILQYAKIKKFRKLAIILSELCLIYTYYVQNIVEIPDILILEYMLLPVVIFAYSLKFIWEHKSLYLIQRIFLYRLYGSAYYRNYNKY